MKVSILLLILLLVPSIVGGSTILTAKKTQGIVELDGRAEEEDWKRADELIVTLQDGSIGKVDISLKALYDREYLYLYSTWKDPTESLEKNVWKYNGTGWKASGDEDRISFAWNIDNSIAGFNIAGCAMVCHGDRMHTNALKERGDIWHWKASRTNPLGYADDEWLDNTIVEGYREEEKEAALHGDESELIYKTGYIKNVNSDGTGPKYYEPSPEDELDAKFIFSDEVLQGDAIEIKDLTEFSLEDSVPGYILRRPTGDRGDIDVMGVWQEGRWGLEFRRKLNTGYENDVQFDVTKTYRFGIAVMDNTGGFEAYGKGHSMGLGARTLEFGGSGSEEVTQLALIKDYLTTAGVHTEKNELEMAVSNINDAIILYDEIRDVVARIDPELYLSTKKQFTEAKREPSFERLSSLSESIDMTTLTFQGKREPPEASTKLKLLVLWGKAQLYALILLAVVSIVPIIRGIQIGRKPAFRRLGIFAVIVMIPLLFEGIGRVGILFKINYLQNFSFLTNEYATLQWALLMFFALFIAKLGFEDVDRSIRSIEYSEKRYRSLFEASPVGIAEVDSEGRILTCNEAAAKIINCPAEGCKNKSFLDLIVDHDEKEEISIHLKEGGSVKDQLITLENLAQEEVVTSISLENILNTEGDVVRSEIAIMDVSDRIKAEEEKRKLEDQLARSARLASVGKLATGVAHEISNPLTNIQLATEILSQSNLKGRVKERLNIITQNVEMASTVIRDLLNFSRTGELALFPIDLEKVIESSIEMVSPRLEDVKVIKKLNGLPEIPGDEKQLKEVFANIIINAVQAMPDGGKLNIETYIEGEFAVVSFKDTGRGIPKEQLEKVFDPFFTTKDVGSGTGLGLSLCYGIVKAHYGDIKVKSISGKGTTVTVHLPLEEKPEKK
ncbi:MAG: ethylbenzene dehydrogenase-related protein [Candidatus Hydrothermarchaeales archaeon]